jgi:hypothetical protein
MNDLYHNSIGVYLETQSDCVQSRTPFLRSSWPQPNDTAERNTTHITLHLEFQLIGILINVQIFLKKETTSI